MLGRNFFQIIKISLVRHAQSNISNEFPIYRMLKSCTSYDGRVMRKSNEEQTKMDQSISNAFLIRFFIFFFFFSCMQYVNFHQFRKSGKTVIEMFNKRFNCHCCCCFTMVVVIPCCFSFSFTFFSFKYLQNSLTWLW